jgi:hypothetical protein
MDDEDEENEQRGAQRARKKRTKPTNGTSRGKTVSQEDRIETMCIQNRALLIALADVVTLQVQQSPGQHGPAMGKALDELSRAILEARPWRK